MSEQEFSALVIDRLARIETGISALNDKLDKLTGTTDDHTSRLSQAEAKILVLESKQGGWKVGLSVITGLVAAAAFILTVLDRLYK